MGTQIFFSHCCHVVELRVCKENGDPMGHHFSMEGIQKGYLSVKNGIYSRKVKDWTSGQNLPICSPTPRLGVYIAMCNTIPGNDSASAASCNRLNVLLAAYPQPCLKIISDKFLTSLNYYFGICCYGTKT